MLNRNLEVQKILKVFEEYNKRVLDLFETTENEENFCRELAKIDDQFLTALRLAMNIQDEKTGDLKIIKGIPTDDICPWVDDDDVQDCN